MIRSSAAFDKNFTDVFRQIDAAEISAVDHSLLMKWGNILSSDLDLLCSHWLDHHPFDPASHKKLVHYGSVPRLVLYHGLPIQFRIPRLACRMNDGRIKTHVFLPSFLKPGKRLLN